MANMFDSGPTDASVRYMAKEYIHRIANLEAENARLRAEIEKAPHDDLCTEARGWEMPCDCWKRAALAGEESNG